MLRRHLEWILYIQGAWNNFEGYVFHLLNSVQCDLTCTINVEKRHDLFLWTVNDYCTNHDKKQRLDFLIRRLVDKSKRNHVSLCNNFVLIYILCTPENVS